MSPTPAPVSAALLTELTRLFGARRQLAARAGATTLARQVALATLVRLGQARVGEVAEALHVDMSAASRQLSALQRDGLVEWRAADGDRRSHLVRPPAAGQAEYARARARIAEWLDQQLADWPPDDLAALTTLLTRLNDALTPPAHCTGSTAPLERTSA